MKLTPACLVICLVYAITCLTSPVNGRPLPVYVRSQHSLSIRSGSSDSASGSSDSDSASGSSDSDSGSSDSDDTGEFDECSSSPCQNGGTCIDATDDYSCTCVDGYIGRNCEEFDECSSSPCQNGGTCIDATNDYNCTCVDGYIGRNCEEFDECSSSPCQNGGTCIDATNDYNCTCVDGYLGRNCEEVEPCLPGWAFYSGSCYYFSQTTNTWEEARNACLSLSMNDGHLVAIHSQAEQDFVNSQMPPGRNYFWIGASDRENEGEFVWVDTLNRNLSFNFWSLGFTTGSADEDCVYFYYKPDMILKSIEGWVDAECHFPLRYICEMGAFYN